MTSSKEYLEYIMEQLSDLDDISYRAMMGEYIIYYREKIVGGIYDDRFLIKPVKTAMEMMPDADMELPYEGAKKMLLVEDVENREFLKELFEAMYDELPARKKTQITSDYSTSLSASTMFKSLILSENNRLTPIDIVKVIKAVNRMFPHVKEGT